MDAAIIVDADFKTSVILLMDYFLLGNYAIILSVFINKKVRHGHINQHQGFSSGSATG